MEDERPPAPDKEAPSGTDEEAPPSTEEVAAPVPEKEASDASLSDSYFHGLQRRVDRILRIRPRPPEGELAKLQALFIELARSLHSSFKRAPEQPERAIAGALDYLWAQAARVSYYLPELRNAIVAALSSSLASQTIADLAPTETGIGAENPKRPTTTKPGRRRNPRYQAIDEELCKINDVRPRSHEEVLRLLDREGVKIPNAEPFKSAGGWTKGYHEDQGKARAWLSSRWARLGLRPFVPGPKKKLE